MYCFISSNSYCIVGLMLYNIIVLVNKNLSNTMKDSFLGNTSEHKREFLKKFSSE
jgi:MFS-type transporter involved in bile tolerance (Atg22 family)